MKRRYKILKIYLLLFVMAVNLNMLFSISVSAADNYSPQNGDFRLSAAVDLSNLTIYQVNTSTSVMYYGKIGAIDGVSNNVLLYFPKIQIVSGSSPQAVLSTYEGIRSGLLTNFLDINTPMITSFSSQGYQKINYLHSNFSPVNAKINVVSSTVSLDTISSFSSISASKYNLYSLKNVNTTLNTTDFSNVVGTEKTESEKFKPIEVLTSDTLVYPNQSVFSNTGETDPQFQKYADVLDKALATNVVRTQDLTDVNSAQTQQTFFAGYQNFQDEAIDQPVKDFVIQSYQEQGIYLDPATLVVNYTSMDDVRTNNQISEVLRQHMIAPLVDQNMKDNGTNSFLGFKVTTKIDFLGFNIFSIQRADADLFGFTMPNINVGGMVNGLVNTATKTVGSIGSTVTNTVKTAINDPKKFVMDTTGSLAKVAMATCFACQGVAMAGPLLKGAVSTVGNLAKPLTDGLGGIANAGLKALNPLSWLGSIGSTFMSFIKPFIPILLVGGAILVIAVLTYFLLPKIVGGILFKKAKGK